MVLHRVVDDAACVDDGQWEAEISLSLPEGVAAEWPLGQAWAAAAAPRPGAGPAPGGPGGRQPGPLSQPQCASSRTNPILALLQRRPLRHVLFFKQPTGHWLLTSLYG